MDYVDEFVINSPNGIDYYGSWLKMLDDWRIRNKEKHVINLQKKEERENFRQKQIAGIVTEMEKQKQTTKDAENRQEEEIMVTEPVQDLTGEHEHSQEIGTRTDKGDEESTEMLADWKTAKKDTKRRGRPKVGLSTHKTS